MRNIKKVGSIFIKYICMYLSMIVPKNKKMMIFGAWMGRKYDDNPKYLFEYVVRNRQDIKAIWITEDKEIFFRLKEEGLPVCLSNTIKAKYLALRAKYVCTATGRIDIGSKNVKYLGNSYYINLWHGIPLKKIMYDDEYSIVNNNTFHNKIRDLLDKIPFRHYYVVSTSKKIGEIYKSAFKVSEDQVLQLGQPRNDCFFLNYENQYTKRFQGKKIILYMPTHRNEGKVHIKLDDIFNLEQLNTICKSSEAVFLVKKHFYHGGEKDITVGYDAIFDITNEITESQTLLDAADILITDYSSCYIDYLLLNRPIIFYNYDIENYKKNDRQMYFEYELVTPGKKCVNYSQLATELINLMNGEDGFKEERIKVRNLFYDPEVQGVVSSKIVDELLKI